MRIYKTSLNSYQVVDMLHAGFDRVCGWDDNDYPSILARDFGWEWITDDALLIKDDVINRGTNKKKRIFLFETSDNVLIIFRSQSPLKEDTIFHDVLVEIFNNIIKEG